MCLLTPSCPVCLSLSLPLCTYTQTQTVQELIAKSSSIDFNDDGPRMVPVLRNGVWVKERATDSRARRHEAPSTLPRAAGGGGGSREFELAFEGSVGLGMNLMEVDPSKPSAPGTPLPPPGYRVIVASVAPGSLAAQQKLRPGVALLAINGQSLRGLGRRDALRLLGSAGKGRRTCEFADFANSGGGPDAAAHEALAPLPPRPPEGPGAPAFATGLAQGVGGTAPGGTAAGPSSHLPPPQAAAYNTNSIIEVPPPVDARSTAARLEALFGSHLLRQSDLVRACP